MLTLKKAYKYNNALWQTIESCWYGRTRTPWL